MGDEAKEAAAKQRIISHMNADHHDSLVFYLRVYSRLPSAAAESAEMEDISLSALTVAARGGRYHIPIEPPMQSLLDARHRLVEMHQHCLGALGLSDTVVTEYRLPQNPIQWLNLGLCLWTLTTFSCRRNFLPGSVLYDRLFHLWPPYAAFCYTVYYAVLVPVLAIHAAEALYVAVYKLRPHRVPLFSRLWFAWFVSTFIDGMGSQTRWNAMVSEKAAKHK